MHYGMCVSMGGGGGGAWPPRPPPRSAPTTDIQKIYGRIQNSMKMEFCGMRANAGYQASFPSGSAQCARKKDLGTRLGVSALYTHLYSGMQFFYYDF